MKIKILITQLLVLFATGFLYAQLTVTTGIATTTLVQNVLVGDGVSVSNITYQGPASSIGRFQTGGMSTNLGISSGIVISSGAVSNSIGSSSMNFASTDNYYSGYSLLTNIAGYETYDAGVLQFNFVPQSDTIRFNYVFGSEEYHEFVSTSFNDAFGFFITGPNPAGPAYNNKNIALIPNSSTAVTINNVNNGNSSGCSYGPCQNCTHFVDNCNGSTIVFDAFTKVLTAWAVVVPCQTYTLKIAVADAFDGIYDSAVFLEANSFSSNAVMLSSVTSNPAMGNDAIEGCNNGIVNFCLPEPAPVNRTVFYTIGGTATNGVDYQNIPNSVVIPAGQTCVQLQIIPASDGITEGTETVTLTVQTSICAQEVITININDYTPLQVSCTGTTSICAGNSNPVPIGVTATNGASPYVYNWSNGLPSTTTHNVNPAQTTTYTVTVSDACGYTATSNVTITVTLNANISITPNTPTICLGTDITLNAAGGSTYLWSTSEQTPSITVSPLQTTSYTVTGTDAAGCTGSASATVNVVPTLTVTATADPPVICIGSSSLITAQGGQSYVWNTNATTPSITVNPQQTSTYTVTGTDSNGCTGSATVDVTVNNNAVITIVPSDSSICQGSPVTLTASGASTYIWSNSMTFPSLTLTPDQTTTYSVTGTDSYGCTGSAQITIVVNPNPTIAAAVSQDEICINAPVTVSASGGLTYIWNNGNTTDSFTENPTASTVYSVTGTDANGCSGTAEIEVTVFYNLTVTITPSNPGICIGDTISLVSTSNGTLPQFIWSSGDSVNSITVFPDSTTVYEVNAEDQYGCTGSAMTTVTVSPIPDVDFTGNPLTGCIPVQVSFTGISDPANSYTWSFGDGTDSDQMNPTHLYSYAGTFTVSLQVVSPFDCFNSITKPNYIQTYPVPIAAFVAFPPVATEDEPTISFMDESIGAASWLWNFNDGDIPSTSTEQHPVYTYQTLGKHTVTLFVENQWGCTDSTAKNIYIKPITTFYIPNAFTPNGDNINDIFIPYGYNVDKENYSFVVYDRWGKAVFATTSLEEGWDGKVDNKSKVAPIGVYTYIINASFNNIKEVFTGSVTLFY